MQLFLQKTNNYAQVESDKLLVLTHSNKQLQKLSLLDLT
mgnify:CR=1 FL=1